jgi:hypothetical protein
MATMVELEQALRNADQAGDTDTAHKLAAFIAEARKEPSNLIPDNPVEGTVPRAPEPTVGEQVVGAGEAALATATGATTGALGYLGGALKGIAEEILTGRFGQGVAEEAAMKGAEALTYAPRTEPGQEYTEAVGKAVEPLMAVAPLAGEMAAIGRGAQAAAPLVRAATQRGVVTPAKQAVARVREVIPTAAEVKPTPGTPPSAGAAGVEQAAVRQAAAEELPVPIELTKGQKERTFEQQRFERETAKLPEEGAPLRERFEQQNQQLQQNMDAFIDQTGAELTTPREVGELVDQSLRQRAAKDKTKIRTLYKEAEKAGEMEAPINLQSVVDVLNESKSAESTAPVLTAAKKELVRLGGAVMDEDGNLVAKDTTKAEPITLRSQDAIKREVPSKFTDQSGLDSLELEALTHYTKDYGGQKPRTLDFDGFEEMQNYLRTGRSKFEPEEVEPIIDTLNSLIDRTKSTKDFDVYRGTGPSGLEELFGVRDIKDIKPGKVGQSKGFLSTSRDEDIAYSFAHEDGEQAGFLIRLEVPKNSKIFDASDLNFESENEFILPPNSQLRVIKSDTESVIPVIYATLESRQPPIAAGSLSLKDAEQLRKFINKTTGNDPTNIKFAADIKRAIDAATEGKGGQKYKLARRARAKYAKEYENVGLVKRLLNTKRGSDDRAIALEDVVNKVVLSPSTSLDEMRHVRRLLQTKGGISKQKQFKHLTLDDVETFGKSSRKDLIDFVKKVEDILDGTDDAEIAFDMIEDLQTESGVALPKSFSIDTLTDSETGTSRLRLSPNTAKKLNEWFIESKKIANKNQLGKLTDEMRREAAKARREFPGTERFDERSYTEALASRAKPEEGLGKQAWRELQGATLRHIQEQMTKGVTTDQQGNRIVSPAQLDRVISQLDKAGKLDFVFGKPGAEKLRVINDVAKDVLTSPPGVVNTSNTASVLAGLMDVAISGTAGVPAPIMSSFRLLTKSIKNTKLKARVKRALGE